MSCPDAGDTAFQFVATLLVFSMMPGLAFFEAGLLRRRSVLSIITQIFLGLAVLNLLWFVAGFSLVFDGDHGGVIGGLSWAFFRRLENSCLPAAPRIPGLIFACFHMMFASITPLLMTGAFAERIRILGFVPFVLLWEILVYYPVAHSVWGGGWLARLGVEDFAGGIVIHATAGAGSIVCALVMGRRVGYDKYEGSFPAHNLPLAAIGAAMLAFGWGSFNAGSAFTAGFVAITAVTNTFLGASAGAVVWAGLSMLKHRKRVMPVLVINGLIAGLAGITPASGFIEPWAAVVTGVLIGLASFGFAELEHHLHIDDALEVGAVHGVPSWVGALAIGFFGSSAVNPAGANGVFYGGGRLLWVQLVALLVVSVWTSVWTFLLIWLFRKMDWFSLQPQHESLGLDGKDHMADAYQSLERGTAEEEEAQQQNAANLYQHGGYGIAYTKTTRQLLPHPNQRINSSNHEGHDLDQDAAI